MSASAPPVSAAPAAPRLADYGDMRWRWHAAADAWTRPCGPVEAAWDWHPTTRGEWELATRIDAQLRRPVALDAATVQQAAMLARFRLPALGVHIEGEDPENKSFKYPRIHAADDPNLLKWAQQVAHLHHVPPDQDVETEAAKVLHRDHNSCMQGPHMLTFTVIAKPDDTQLSFVFRYQHALFDVWGLGAAYHVVAHSLLSILSRGLTDLRWGQEADNLPLWAGRVCAQDCGDSPEQSKAAHDWLQNSTASLGQKVPHSLPTRIGVATRPYEFRWHEWTLSRAETDRVVAAAKKLGVTVTSFITAAIWTATKYVDLQHESRTSEEFSFLGAIVINARQYYALEHQTHQDFPGWPTQSVSCAFMEFPSLACDGASYTVDEAIKEARSLIPSFAAELQSIRGPEAFPARAADSIAPLFFANDRFWEPCEPVGPVSLVISSLGVLDPPEKGLLPAELVCDGITLRTTNFHFRIRAFKRCIGFHPYTIGGRLTMVANFNARIIDPDQAVEMMRVCKQILLGLAAS